MSKEYFLATGNADQQRQTILQKVYNKTTLDFLIECGLKKSMTVLDYCCKNGQFAIKLANFVGPEGKVIAVESKADSLQLAADTAKKSGVTNIDFQFCKLDDIANLDIKFDFIFGRWSLIFSTNPENVLLQLQTLLKPGGTLISEELNFDKDGHFSHPHEPLVDAYHQIVLANSKKANLPLNLADDLYAMFRNNNFTNIRAKTNQPIFITPEEKSLYRLSLISMRQAILSNNLYTEAELFKLEESFKLVEKNKNLLIGGYRNILISGSKLL